MRTKDSSHKARNYPIGFPRGHELLHDPIMNKGTAFTHEERDALGLWGLLPPRVFTQEEQVMRVMENFHEKPTDLERYIQMMALLDRNETLFYRVVMDHIETLMPIIYMPTVGQACQEYGHIFRKPRGIFLSAMHRCQFAKLLMNWSHDEVRVIVVTDGERVFGIGDLGAHGMGTSVGKLILYTACAGVHPSYCLPVMLDVGTDNQKLLNDPLYFGLKQPRLRGEEYDEIVEEFVTAVQEIFPQALIQFEDMAGANSFRLLRKFREKACVFNNDIQSRAAVTLAGLYSAAQLSKVQLKDQVILFAGASEGGIAIGDLIVSAMKKEGLAEEQARSRCWFVDSKGLVVKSRKGLAGHKLPYAHDHAPIPDLLTVVKTIKPSAIIGVSGRPGTFTRPVLQAMARFNKKPIVFVLSNPTTEAECTAKEAYTFTKGQALFASSRPAEPFVVDGKKRLPDHVNTTYISPGLVLGVFASEAAHVSDGMFLAAAGALAGEVSNADLKKRMLFPPIERIREVSAAIGTAVAEAAYQEGLAEKPELADLPAWIKSQMYEPVYLDYV